MRHVCKHNSESALGSMSRVASRLEDSKNWSQERVYTHCSQAVD